MLAAMKIKPQTKVNPQPTTTGRFTQSCRWQTTNRTYHTQPALYGNDKRLQTSSSTDSTWSAAGPL